MENKKGVDALNNLLSMMQTELLSNPFVNTVTLGIQSDEALEKTTIFPLAHIVLNSVSYPENTLLFNISVVNLDIVCIEKERDNGFYSNDNVVTILTNQLYVINRLIARLRRTNDNNDGYELSSVPQSNMIEKQKGDMLIGYATDFNIVLPNDINKC